MLPSVGRELECKQIRTSLLTVSATCQRVWVINGTRDLGQFDCVVGQLNQGCALFECAFLFDGRSGGGVLEGLTAIGVQISSACTGLTAREKAAMFPSMYSVADWFKRRMDKPKLLARTPTRRTPYPRALDVTLLRRFCTAAAAPQSGCSCCRCPATFTNSRTAFPL